MATETWVKMDENGKVIERGQSEKLMDSVTLKKDSKGQILWEIKVYGKDIHEATKTALEIKEQIEKEVTP